MNVLCFGSLNIDYTYSVPHFVRKGETLSSTDLRLFAGGKGLNQSIALARAGLNVSLAGAIGEDGRFLLAELHESGVDTRWVDVLPGMRTGHAIIQNDAEGDNCILVYGGANHCTTREQIDRVLTAFGAGDVLTLQNEIRELDYLIRAAKAKGLRVALTPAPMNEAVEKLPLRGGGSHRCGPDPAGALRHRQRGADPGRRGLRLRRGGGLLPAGGGPGRGGGHHRRGRHLRGLLPGRRAEPSGCAHGHALCLHGGLHRHLPPRRLGLHPQPRGSAGTDGVRRGIKATGIRN